MMLRFFQCSQLYVSPAPSFSTTHTALHPLPQHMPKAPTTVNMIGPSHKGKAGHYLDRHDTGQAKLISTVSFGVGIVYVSAPYSLSVLAFRVFQYIWAVWRIWEEMACRTQHFLVKTNIGSPLLHTQDKRIDVIVITNECSHNSLSVCYKAQNITLDT